MELNVCILKIFQTLNFDIDLLLLKYLQYLQMVEI